EIVGGAWELVGLFVEPAQVIEGDRIMRAVAGDERFERGNRLAVAFEVDEREREFEIRGREITALSREHATIKLYRRLLLARLARRTRTLQDIVSRLVNRQRAQAN